MLKTKNSLICLELKINTSKGCLPHIQNFDYSYINSPELPSPGSGSNGKVLKKSRTLAECFRRKHGKSELIDPEVQKFHRISLRLEKILAQSQFKYGATNEFEIKSLSPRNEICFKSGSFKYVGLKKKFSSPDSIKTNLNKHAIRSRVFENTIKWINS